MGVKKLAKKTKTKVRVQKDSDISGNSNSGFFDKVQKDLENRHSYLNLILGFLIIIVAGVLIYNYFNRPSSDDLGPSQTTEESTTTTADVSKDNLPGKYTVKEGDTLFLIAEKYYDDGYKFNLIVDANKLSDPNNISANQVLEIPKPDQDLALTPSPIPEANEASPSPASVAQTQSPSPQPASAAVGGALNQTSWGESIKADTYTVTEGDWLSTIAGRAYGDIYAYEKIAKANNISNPDLIEVGTVLKIPR